MRQALLILRKDVRHLWPQVAAFWALLAGYTCLSAATPTNPKIAMVIFMPALALMLACFYLIGVLVHEDAPAGDRQFWTTRPFDWRGLLAAKALFALLFIALPLFVSQVVALAVNGLPIAVPVSKLASMGALLASAFVFAALTRNLTQFFLLVMITFVGAGLLTWFILNQAYENGDWGSLEWVRGASTSLLFLSGTVALLVLPYRRHSTKLCRGLFAALFLLMPAFQCLNWWHAAWDVQMWLYGNKAAAPPVSLSFDASAPPPAKGRWYYYARDNVVGVNIPIQVRGIPDGMQLVGERLRTRVEVPGGRSWDSGWRAVGGIGAVDGGPHIVRHNGPALLAVNIDTAFFDEVRRAPAHVRIRLAFAVLGKPEAARLRLGAPPQRVSTGCLCSLPANFDGAVWCLSAEGDDVRREVYWESPEDLSATGIRVPSSMFQPFATQQHRRRDSLSPPLAAGFATLSTRRVENYIEAELEIPEIQLGAHEVGRSRGARQVMEGLRIHQ